MTIVASHDSDTWLRQAPAGAVARLGLEELAEVSSWAWNRGNHDFQGTKVKKNGCVDVSMST